MTREMISAHHRAAAAFNDIVSAARIAIEALAKIAAEPGRAIAIVENSLTEIEVILRPSELAERLGSTGGWRSFLKGRPEPACPHRQPAIAAAPALGQRA